MSVIVDPDGNILLYAPNAKVNVLSSEGDKTLRNLSSYAFLGDAALKEAFFVVGVHGDPDGIGTEYGTHRSFFNLIAGQVRANLRDRAILYLACWGGEMGAKVASEIFAPTPVIGCGSEVIVSLNKSARSISFRSNPFSTTRETGQNRYRNWVVAWKGNVQDCSARGINFDADYFIEKCARMQGQR